MTIPLLAPLLGFAGGIGGVATAVFGAITTIGRWAATAVRWILKYTVEFLKWMTEHPEEGITLVCLAWVFLAP